jgi:hypothetical protein
MTLPYLFFRPCSCLDPTRSEIYLPMSARWCSLHLHPVNCGLPALVTWTDAVVVLCCVEARICDFSCPTGGMLCRCGDLSCCRISPCCSLSPINPSPSIVARCMLSRGSPGAGCVVGDKLALLLMLLPVYLVQCYPFIDRQEWWVETFYAISSVSPIQVALMRFRPTVPFSVGIWCIDAPLAISCLLC